MTIPKGRARFTCNTQPVSINDYRIVTKIEWLLNNMALQNFNHHNTTILPGFNSDLGIGVLKFENIAVELNMTSVICDVSFGSGSQVISNHATLILIEGI